MKYLTFLIVATAVLLFHGSARAGPYSLEIIVRQFDVVDNHTIISPFSSNPNNISINNEGEVAFLAKVFGPNGQGWGVMTQNRFIAGAGKLVDGRRVGFDNQDHTVKINNLGQVTYTGFLLDAVSGRGVFVDETLIAERGDVIDGRTILSPDFGPAINDDGTVVFLARQADEGGERGPFGVFTPDRLVVESGQVIDGFTIGKPFGVEISNTGEIFFYTFLSGFGDDPSMSIVTPDRIVFKPGDVIDGQRVDLIDSFTLSENGDVVMSFWRLSDGVREDKFVATETEILVRTGDVVDGLTLEFAFDERMNDAGQLAFFGSVKNETGDDQHLVLFADDQIIAAEGDLLAGKIIEQLRGFDMNRQGDLAFFVKFEDSSKVIVLANHIQIPEPSAFVLAVTALITFFHVVGRRTPRAIRRRRARRAEIR
ncbi:MAG: hypothetical protein IID44_14965 [Planctomycetes bacterium]|nr:hypothetical protein [Planctomycetota bacterium]